MVSTNRLALLKKRWQKIASVLKERYPEARCDLPSDSAWNLLVSTILSAQSTDASVIKVTPSLFKKYKNIKAFASVSPPALEKDIRAIGLSKSKSRNIVASAKIIIKHHNSKVPDSIEKLISLPGVGRKTACVVLGNYFGVPAIAVDTHVKRLSYRMGFTEEIEPAEIERDLMIVIPQKSWTLSSHLLIRLGREFCKSKSSDCENCPVRDHCPKIIR